MHYKLQDQYYKDFSTIDVNRLPGRSYFIPYPNRQSVEAVTTDEKRYKSPLVVCLNGDWDFNYYNDPKTLPLEFDSDKLEFGKIDVPSVWQYRGYSHPMYLNVRYPFPYKPPVIPTTEPVSNYFSSLDGFKKAPSDEMNHVGLYRTFFNIPDRKSPNFNSATAKSSTKPSSNRYILSFLGVCSCIEVHVNGKFVGYSEESHNTAEFDITQNIVQGQNELVCVVRRWCNGSYLECQDMFRNNGIFRDVLLRISNKDDIWDIDIKTKNQGSAYTTTYTADVSAFLSDDMDVSFTLEGPLSLVDGSLNSTPDTNSSEHISRTITAKSIQGVAKVSFKDLPVVPWSAENPVLYNLFIETSYSCIQQKIGFKDIEIRGNLYLLNGRKIKFKGVNHHDTDPKNGYAMSPADIRRDLELCKKFNIDTIRTSHYAPDPLLMELAAELGLYIISEVDIETHGVLVGRIPPSYNRLSNDPTWKKHYISRASRHYLRDKALSTPVIMWSLGNESGGGCNTDATYDYFKSVSDIPVHYESAIYTARKAYDIASRMYPPVSELHDIAVGTCKTPQFMDRPYVMCEYAHAMGVGPGNIEGYWTEVFGHDSLLGGCVWEMNDHAVQHPDGTYTYGGDHGEWIHDSNFCCDGIFYPDRTPSTGAWIVRHAYRPIRLSHLQGSTFQVFNTTAFTPGQDFKMHICLSNGITFDYTPTAGPLEKQTVTFNLGEIGPNCTLTADTYNRLGLLVSTEQITLSQSIMPEPAYKTALPSWFSLQDGKPTFDLGHSKMTTSDPYTILFRAETDNDSIDFIKKPMRKWYKQQTSLLTLNEEPTSQTVQWTIKVAGLTFLCTDQYQGCSLPDGSEAILLTSTLHRLRGKGKIPRFGKAFKLDQSLDAVHYHGRSGESYIDMKEQFPILDCTTPVTAMVEPNIRPQESGNRCDTTFATLYSSAHNTTNSIVSFLAIDKPYELSVKPYSDIELIGMKHRQDQKTTGTYVTINAFQQGIGTGSCGPYTLDQHLYDASNDYQLKVLITRSAITSSK